jgi:hypothetical protein
VTVRSELEKSLVAARGDGTLFVDVMPGLLGN